MATMWSEADTQRVGHSANLKKQSFAERAAVFRSSLRRAAADTLQRRIYLASLMFGMLLIALAGRSLVETHRLAQHAADEELGTHIHAIALGLRESLSLADFTAKQARKQWLEDGRLKVHADYVEDFPNFKDLIAQVAIIDKEGFLKASSLSVSVPNTYLGDRAHFNVHRASQTDAVFISEPVLGRVSNTKTVQLTRPVFNHAQQFDGVVVISLNPVYIQNILFDQTRKPDLKVLLVGADNRLRVGNIEQPGAGEPGPQPPEALITMANANVTYGEPDNHYWRTLQLDEYALTLKIGVPKSRIDQRFHRTSAAIALGTVLIVLFMIYYTRRLLLVVQDRNSILHKLEESKIKASSANAMKSKFVSSISHELRTPLNGILGFSELIGMSDDFAEAKRYAQIVNKSATHLHQLVNTLLDLAKIEAGQMEITRIHSDVREICDSVASIHRYSIEKKGLILDVSYEPNIPKIIYTDHIKLMQILNNLLNNAVKFTDEGAIFLTIALEQDAWSFSVADTGIGMTPQQLKDIFTRFNNIKLDQYESADRPGAGLGMALCKDLVELLGGTIEVYSEPKVGTVVKVLLPQIHANNQI